MTPRIAPASRDAWRDDVRSALTTMYGDARPPEGFTTLANHPDLMMTFLPVGAYVLEGSTLPARDRELAVLRLCSNAACEYEWGYHARLAPQAGLTADEIARVAAGPDAAGWDDLDRALLTATDELCSSYEIGDATWTTLARHRSVQQLMDLVVTVGYYGIVAMSMKSFGVPLDPNLDRLPASDADHADALAVE